MSESLGIIAVTDTKNSGNNCTEPSSNNKSENNSLPEKNSSDSEIDPAHLHYEDDICIYTDPDSKHQYVWDENKSEWVFRHKEEQKGVEKILNSSGISPEDYEFDGESYTYADKVTGVVYKFDSTKNQWIEKQNKENELEKKEEGIKFKSKDSESEEEFDDDDEERGRKIPIRQDMSAGTYGFEDDTHTFTDGKDGTKYFWDKEKNAWFPKVDDEFLALYQLSYGFVDPNVEKNPSQPNDKIKKPVEVGVKRKAPPEEPKWFNPDDEHNTKVYVSNLPTDITEQEFVDVMQKCGLVMRDPETHEMKIKLYTDPGTTSYKGDGLCSYIKVESVNLALKLLDGFNLRGNKIKVERAQFQMKGEYNPALKPKKKKKKDKDKLKRMQEKLFDWRPEKLRGMRGKNEKVVIIKNLFDPKIFDNEVSLILEYQQDLREEGSKCGEVKRVVIYDRHPEGVAQISFKEPEQADQCVQLLNGRWFCQRKITAEIWDGKTKYKIGETDAEIKQRMEKWNKFLETDGEMEGKSIKQDAETKSSQPSIPSEKETQNVISSETKNDRLLESEPVVKIT